MNDDKRTQSIRTILLKEWDPLIVGDNPHLSDEYDDLIPSIVGLVENHCTLEQLERYLKDIEERWKSTSVKQTSFVARRILDSVQLGA
ncbi:MAG: hypothetical protein WBF43_10045 [Methylocella sp.]